MNVSLAGSWSTVSDDMANLYPGSASGVNTQASLAYYISKGITASKITMGKSFPCMWMRALLNGLMVRRYADLWSCI